MKITNKEIKECTLPNWDKTTILDLQYTHKWEKGRVLLDNYDDKYYNKVLKLVRKAAIEQYNLIQEKWALLQN